MARVLPAIRLSEDHSVSMISPSIWPAPMMKLGENFGRQSR